jgi:CRP-like cAMP-binding protein
MLPNRLIEYIQRYVPLTVEEQERILRVYRPHSLKRKEFLYVQGKRCEIEAFVLSGALRVFYADTKGHDHVLNFALPDWWVGDITSFTEGTPSMTSVQALEDSELLVIDPPDREALLRDIPQLEHMFRIILQKHLVSFQKRFLSAVSETADVRYKNLLEKMPTIEQLVPQHQIASYLGILPESLSRMKKQLLHSGK